MSRNIEICFDESMCPPDVPLEELWKAIGRLSWWASSQYDLVCICKDGKNDLVAYYGNVTGPGKYTIGAVWRPDSRQYTFHS